MCTISCQGFAQQVPHNNRQNILSCKDQVDYTYVDIVEQKLKGMYVNCIINQSMAICTDKSL